MSDRIVKRLAECKTLIKLVALGEAKAGVDACNRIDEAATHIAQLEARLRDLISNVESGSYESTAQCIEECRALLGLSTLRAAKEGIPKS